MLFHNVLRVCFLALLAPKIETNAQLNSDTKKAEGLFSDVIRNISRVNTELQELINNYDKLKKLQDSIENLDDNKNDAEGGRVNRNSKNSVGYKRDTSVKTSTTLKHHTEMIYVEEEAGKSSEPETSIDSEKSNEVEKNREVVQKTTTQASIVNEEPIAPKEETEPEKQELVDIYKKKIKPDRKIPVIPEADQQTSKNTKYSEKETKSKYLSHNSSESDSSVDSEWRTEDEEVKENKPKERAFEKVNHITHVTSGVYLRSENNRTNQSTIIIKKADNDLSLEFTDDDESFSKDLFKTSVLREAYGDACLKVVIRKCYRACRSAYSLSCPSNICKNELKTYFGKRSRRGCIDAYNASSKGDDFDNLRRVVVPNTSNGGIMTREGYLSVACQTQIKKPTRRMSNVTSIKNGEQVNILRGIYEKACQKISQNKCSTACQSAERATCDKFKCTKHIKKTLKRNCRLECKRAFSNKSNKAQKSSDSDDSSDADSDDESGDSYDDDDDGDDDDES